MIFALVGNQNCGKTTLFNQLTGSNQHVGNFPGVTVEQKSGIIRGHSDVSVVDLPGIYSLSPYTSEEMVTRDFILKQKPDGIINIVDATNIERNLYLTLQIIDLGIPTVLALNMMDEMRNNGGSIKIKEFSNELGIPVIPISAVKNEGINELVNMSIQTVNSVKRPQRVDFCQGAVHRCIHGIAHLIEDHAKEFGIPSRFAATKIIEGDEPLEDALHLNQNEKETIEHCINEMESEMHTDREAALADMRYAFIEGLCNDTVIKPVESKESIRSTKIDKVLTNKYFGIPLFLAIMLTVFWLTFSVIGKALSGLLTLGINALSSLTLHGMQAAQINPVMQDLIIHGVFSGVGSVLSFLPIIVTLFLLLSLLEDSGYMARVSFLMDKPLRKLGLSGKSFVPMLIGFGCSVPAIMSTRTLSSERDKKMTVMLIPFMSCSAKLPIYALLSAAFFPKYAPFVMLLLYITGILTGILCAFLFKNTVFKGNSSPFIMELPNYRIPSAKSVWLLAWGKAKDFLQRAFTIIFVASLIIWFMQTFDFRFNLASSSSNSMLAMIGSQISILFKPLGFGDWRATTALISGFTAKEAVLSTLAVLTNKTIDTLSKALTGIFTPLSAVSFLVFTLLYTPCVASIAAVRREFGKAWSLFVIVFQIAIAWIMAFAVFQMGSLLF